MNVLSIGYKSLLKDDGFSDLTLVKVRRLLGLGLAEMLGTAVFVALGCGNVVEHISNSSPAHLNTVISFSFGIATSIIVSSLESTTFIFSYDFK